MRVLDAEPSSAYVMTHGLRTMQVQHMQLSLTVHCCCELHLHAYLSNQTATLWQSPSAHCWPVTVYTLCWSYWLADGTAKYAIGPKLNLGWNTQTKRKCWTTSIVIKSLAYMTQTFKAFNPQGPKFSSHFTYSTNQLSDWYNNYSRPSNMKQCNNAVSVHVACI